jgi:MFS family permease
VTTAFAARLSSVFQSSPLRHAPFRLFYFGSVATALGYTMQATVAAWLMATLTPSPLMVALVQTASTAPALLFGLLAGTLADIVQRRKIIGATQVVLLIATAMLGGATLAAIIGPGTLLALTFLVGIGFTFYMPAQQASINELVSRAELPRAVALSAVAFNVARALGPALAGAIAAWLGSGSAFLASALFFILMIVAVRGWKHRESALPGLPETLLSGVQSGLRFARHSAPMRSLIIRNLSFCVCASALWALLPIIARDQLGLGAGGYGLLSAGFGIGAVVGALAIPGQLQRRSLNAIVTSGVILWIFAALLIAASRYTAIALVGTCGARTLRLDEPHRDASESRAGECALGGVGSGDGNPDRTRGLGRLHGCAVCAQSPRSRRDGDRGRRDASPAATGPRDRGRAIARRRSGPDPARIPDRSGASRSILARHSGGRADAAPQWRCKVARLSRPE